MRLRFGLFLVSLFTVVGQIPPEFRLPNTVRPERYQLDLTLRPDRPTFHGRVEIEVLIAASTNLIWLNAKDLTVTEASIQTTAEHRPARAIPAGDEFVGLSFDAPVPAGKARIALQFTGKLADKSSVGVYRRSENEKWYVFTSFTAIDARRAFPCFDQPEFKTPWKVTLHVPERDIAVANARQVSEVKEADGLKRVAFSETKPIPSEVVAFAVGPFDIVDDGIAGRNRIPVRIIAPHGRGAEAAGARGATREILARLEDYTGIPYMWDKLDHIALLDMPFGATENPGLITYRDRILLAPPARDTAEHRQAMRGTMAHELAHQWFGNLVTQRWWDEVWLSEGFATWLGTKTADLELPESQRGVAAVQNRARIMNADTRPVRLDMHSRKDMEQVYSGIVYQKGASILRMTEHWLGEEPFRRGLQRYLKAHAYGSATTADLAAALREETHVDVTPVFASYLNQAGFPELHATLDCALRKAIIEQKSDLSWNTPVCAEGKCTVISGPKGELAISTCPAWINDAGAGYYRLRLHPLADRLKSGWDLLTAPERLSLVEDVATLSAAEQVAALPTFLHDRNPQVAAAAQRIALRLAVTPGADLDALRKVVR